MTSASDKVESDPRDAIASDRGRAGGLITGVLAVAIWGSAFTAIHIAIRGFGPIGLVPVRLCVAAMVLILLSRLSGARLLPIRYLPRVLACAVVGMIGYQTFLNIGETQVAPGTASMLLAAAPLVGALVVKRDHTNRAGLAWWASSIACLSGVVLTCLDAVGATTASSLALVALAAMLYGLYPPLVKPLLGQAAGLSVVTSITLVAALLSLPLFLVEPVNVKNVTASSLAAACFLGIVPSATAFLLWTASIRRLRTVETSALLYLVPVFGMVVAILCGKQIPTPLNIIGVLLVLVGVFSGSISCRRADQKASR